MKIGGWIFLIVSWVIILGLSTFCLVRVLTKKELK